jgi:hypothetical protein
MKASVRLLVAAALCASFALVQPVHADTTATSTITQIKVVDEGSDNYKLFHGAVWLEYDKAEYNYRWGGKHCDGKSLSDMNISLLFAAFRSKYSVNMDYETVKYRKSSYRCVTGFTVTRS